MGFGVTEARLELGWPKFDAMIDMHDVRHIHHVMRPKGRISEAEGIRLDSVTSIA